ncbi:YtxH domain-containing protein [Flavobacterium sp.]|uniref:YtxH domain-containing protein n=1 Tax=Flavobacterium sp. TaxID=239 RepID=UPI002B4B8F6A|nr:YtxH domain-containing protein [Flavobacterium sp.]HLP64449.1 YtxH domain-containing protein [Flavobacterium sp.]
MKTNRVAVGVLGGIAAGALLGILFAPHKGSKTREKILNKRKGYTDAAKEKLEEVITDFTKKSNGLWDDAKDIVTKDVK